MSEEEPGIVMSVAGQVGNAELLAKAGDGATSSAEKGGRATSSAEHGF